MNHLAQPGSFGLYDRAIVENGTYDLIHEVLSLVVSLNLRAVLGRARRDRLQQYTLPSRPFCPHTHLVALLVSSWILVMVHLAASQFMKAVHYIMPSSDWIRLVKETSAPF